MRFEINLFFLMKLFFFIWPKSQDKTLDILRMRSAFKMKVLLVKQTKNFFFGRWESDFTIFVFRDNCIRSKVARIKNPFFAIDLIWSHILAPEMPKIRNFFKQHFSYQWIRKTEATLLLILQLTEVKFLKIILCDVIFFSQKG